MNSASNGYIYLGRNFHSRGNFCEKRLIFGFLSDLLCFGAHGGYGAFDSAVHAEEGQTDHPTHHIYSREQLPYSYNTHPDTFGAISGNISAFFH